MPLHVKCTRHTLVPLRIQCTWHTAVHDFITHTDNVVLFHCVITCTMYSAHSFAPCHNTYNAHTNNVSLCRCVLTRTVYLTHSSALCDYTYNIRDTLLCRISLHILTMRHCVTMSLHAQCTRHTRVHYVITHRIYLTRFYARCHFSHPHCVTVSLRVQCTWHTLWLHTQYA